MGLTLITTALVALAKLVPAANKIPYFNASTTAANLDLLDEDNLVSDSATGLATQQSIKAYVDGSSLNALLDEDDFNSDSAVKAPSQQSAKAYIASQIIDEDDLATDSAVLAPSQQSVKAYVDGLDGTLVWDVGSLADGAGETSGDITVTGAAFGDFVLVAAPASIVGMTVTAYVHAADTVHIRVQNESGGVVDLAEGTWKVKVLNR